MGTSWCNLIDDITTCPMMTSHCHRVNNVRFGLGFRQCYQYDDITSFHYDVIIVKLHQEPP